MPFEDYPSVMNYNAPSDYLYFSTGGSSDDDFDDWTFLDERAFVPSRAALSTGNDSRSLRGPAGPPQFDDVETTGVRPGTRSGTTRADAGGSPGENTVVAPARTDGT